MITFFDKNKYITCSSIKKKIKDLYNIDYDLKTIHMLMSMSKLTPYECVMPNKKVLNVYIKSDFEKAIKNGIIKHNINNFELSKNTNISNKLPIITNEPIITKSVSYKQSEPRQEKDYATYKNGENDMEEYSNYLINNVYENKMQLTFNDLQEIVKKSVISILTENKGIKSKKIT